MVANYKIGMTRGDSKAYKFQRKYKDANGVIHPITQIADKVFFTVKKSYRNQEFLLQKRLSDMTFDENAFYHFMINPEDTNNIDFGTYVYDVEVITNGHKFTISSGNFVLGYENTWASNEGGNND